MNSLIEHLWQLSAADNKVRAVLRRSLAFEPGTYFEACRYVEPFVAEEKSPWQRQVSYLVAGLWAAHTQGQSKPLAQALAFQQACKRHWQTNEKSISFESRFLALLDADEGQLPHRLRQMLALLKDQPLDFSQLLNDLNRWQGASRSTQTRWAQAFYSSEAKPKADPTPSMENQA